MPKSATLGPRLGLNPHTFTGFQNSYICVLLHCHQACWYLSYQCILGMSARFRVGSAIAQACQSVGYRDNIGYQTFLYSSEVDIRKIFMFLIEKLPRKEGVKDDEGKHFLFSF